MDSIQKMAQLFADRNNPLTITITVGEVIEVDPLRIRYGSSIILEQRKLILSSSLLNGFKGEYTVDGVTREIIVKNELQPGEKVMMIPNKKLSIWYVLDKIGVRT